MTPDPNITYVGFSLYFLRMYNDTENKIIEIKSISLIFNENPEFPQKERIIIETPADAIRETTAGLKPLKTPCITFKFLYLKYIHPKTDTIIQDGNIHPRVETIAP